ncbi:MAG: type II toxin-antitoxin system RatA family toxin [Sterolibacterium sp.]
MTVIEKSVLIDYTASQMFELVDRVEDYPLFLPWCSATELLERTENKTAGRIHVNFQGIKTDFSTENPKEVPVWMNISLRDGPFKSMDGGWRFTPLGESACKVEFRLHYEFSSKLLEKALGRIFDHLAGTLVESFVKRARQIYG